MLSGVDQLSPRQVELMESWLPGAEVVGDHSWGLVGTTVLELLASDGRRYVAKAGELLALFHRQLAVEDDGEFEVRQKEDILAWLSRPHRIAPDAAAQLADVVEAWSTSRSIVVPTHGDWQPRNWLAHDDRVSVIDFGRADLRPALTDFGRLAAQQFRANPALEHAFVEGYGADPREPEAWLRNRIRDAVGTAAWAYQVGDVPFERQGHRMITEVLADL